MKSRLLFPLIFLLIILPARAQDATTPLEVLTAANVPHIEEIIHYDNVAGISPDSERVVMTAQDGQTSLVNLLDGQELAVLGENVNNLTFNQTSEVLKGILDRQAVIWDARSGLLRCEIPFPLGEDAADTDWDSVDTVFSPDGLTLAAYLFDGTQEVVLWDTASCQEKFRIQVDEFFYQIAFSPDSRLIVLYDSPDRVLVWDVASQEQFAAIETPYFNLSNWSWMEVRFKPDSSAFAIINDQSPVSENQLAPYISHIYDLNTQGDMGEYQGYLERFSDMGTDLIISSDTAIDFYDASNGQSRISIPIAPDHEAFYVTLSPDETRLGYVEHSLSGNDSDSFFLWDVTGSTPITVAETSGDYMESLRFSPNSALLTMSLVDMLQIQLTDAAAGSPLLTIPGTVAIFSADGTRLFVFDQEGSMQVWGIPQSP